MRREPNNISYLGGLCLRRCSRQEKHYDCDQNCSTHLRERHSLSFSLVESNVVEAVEPLLGARCHSSRLAMGLPFSTNEPVVRSVSLSPRRSINRSCFPLIRLGYNRREMSNCFLLLVDRVNAAISCYWNQDMPRLRMVLPRLAAVQSGVGAFAARSCVSKIEKDNNFAIKTKHICRRYGS